MNNTQTTQHNIPVKGKQPSNFDGKLGERINKIINAAEEAVERDGLELEVEIEVPDWSDGAIIDIDPTSDWSNKGEYGFYSFHIILGPRGGILSSLQHRTATSSTHLDEKTKAFEKTLSRIRDMV